MTQFVKLVVFVPKSHSNIVRQAMGKAAAGIIGNYSFSSFSVIGTGRFLPLKGAKPAIGKIGQLEQVVEERIETICSKKILNKVIKAIKKVHPYEELALDVYPLFLDPDKISSNEYKKD